MHFKLDEDLPGAVARLLREHGYECSTVIEQGIGGTKDPDLWKRVQEHEQFLITADKGFGDVRSYAPGTHRGILLLRPVEDGVRPLLDLAEQVLRTVGDLGKLEGLVAVASPQGLRLRRPGA